jgi:site-specific recombinase XerD
MIKESDAVCTMKMDLTFVVVDSQLDYYIDLFLRIKRASREPATVAWYKSAFNCYRSATAHLPDWPPGLEHCLAFLEEFKSRGLSEHSCDNYYRSMRAFFNWLVEIEALPKNPLFLVDAPPTPDPLPSAPRIDNMISLLKTVADAGTGNWRYVRDMALFSLALDTGARIGEIEKMTTNQIDLLNQQIDIYATKVHKGRILEMGDDCVMRLSAWIERRIKLKQHDKWPAGLNHVFVSFYQKKVFRPWTGRGIRTRLRYWQNRAGVPRFHFNSFRHAYAVYSIWNGANLLDIKTQMGHKSIRTTSKYLEVADEQRKARHRRTSPLGNLE